MAFTSGVRLTGLAALVLGATASLFAAGQQNVQALPLSLNGGLVQDAQQQESKSFSDYWGIKSNVIEMYSDGILYSEDVYSVEAYNEFYQKYPQFKFEIKYFARAKKSGKNIDELVALFTISDAKDPAKVLSQTTLAGELNEDGKYSLRDWKQVGENVLGGEKLFDALSPPIDPRGMSNNCFMMFLRGYEYVAERIFTKINQVFYELKKNSIDLKPIPDGYEPLPITIK